MAAAMEPLWRVVRNLLGAGGVLLCLWISVSFTMPRRVPDDFRVMPSALAPRSIYVLDRRLARAGESLRGKVVAFRPPGEAKPFYAARVLAVEGDLLRFDKGEAFVNGGKVRSDDLRLPPAETSPEFRIPQGHLFLLVDDGTAAATQALDSRAFGAIPLWAVDGIVMKY